MPEINVKQRLHVRYEGETFNFDLDEIEIADNPTNAQIIEAASQAVSEQLGRDVNLNGYEVERYEENGLFDVHPQAKFG